MGKTRGEVEFLSDGTPVVSQGSFLDGNGPAMPDSHAALISELASARQENARLREARTVRLTYRGDDWHACFEDDPALWERDVTAMAALGQLVRSHRERFGVAEIIIDDYRNRSTTEERKCHACDGCGQIANSPCPGCGGKGTVTT